MRRTSSRRVEEQLRSGALGARRQPSTDLRARIDAALESGAPRASSLPSIDRAPRRLWSPILLAAASVLIAVGIWRFAVSNVPQDDATRFSPASEVVGQGVQPPRRDTVPAIDDAASPEAFARLARSAPGTFRSIIDDSLFAELGNIAVDARRAAHFLVGRVPESFVARDAEDASR
jgi:hypothetical protein